ncbi:MAG: sulfide/dihydroorotate dehydrogenase-like FAD/NAD-binding protein [Planctomycetota bacterium]
MRFPLTIADGDATRGTITLIVQGIGKTTRLINALEAGQFLLDVVGPLGNASEIRKYGTVVVIAGGVGTAIAWPTARALKQAGNRVLTMLGARSEELVILEEELRAISDGLFITTDDGSYGRRGLVTDKLNELIRNGEQIDFVLAIGPIPMMRGVAEVTRAHGIPTTVSLNSIMVDGTGMCGGCRVLVGGEARFACVDGPEFDAHLVNFNVLAQRNAMYRTAERDSFDGRSGGHSRRRIVSASYTAPLPTSQAAANPWQAHTVAIREIRPEVEGVATYDLAFRDEAVRTAYRFAPGQFNMLYLPGAGEIAISISDDPRHTESCAHTIRVAGNVTRSLAGMKVGETLGLRGPFGTSWPLAECIGRDVALVTGGIGLVPLRPAICTLLDDRRHFGRLNLLYGARSPNTLLYARGTRRRRVSESSTRCCHWLRAAGFAGRNPGLCPATRSWRVARRNSIRVQRPPRRQSRGSRHRARSL